MIRSRRRAADKQHYRQWLVETLGEVRATVEAEVAAQFLDAEQALTLALNDAVDRRVEALDQKIAELDLALRSDAAERDRGRRRLDRRIAAVNRVVAEIDAVLPRLRAATPGSASIASIVSAAADAIGARERPGSHPAR
ncbi:MAG: hypothetical protein HYR62_02370 [Actinobacteria bacterium]|nr:hypothetical protein [Actinomycetota bacterium]MBI3687321.1 hypothetical protein [Actinomycetota bacterium]